MLISPPEVLTFNLGPPLLKSAIILDFDFFSTFARK